MPASRARSMSAKLSPSLVSGPKFMVPRQRRLTRSPLRPRWTYCMAGVLARRDGPPYRPRSFESAAPASGERSEHGEIPPVLREVGALRRLDAHGKAGEAPVAEQPAKGAEAEAAPADVLVAIEPPAERALRVVQVEGDDPVDAQFGVELGERGRVAGGRAQVVARGEGVLGVEADAQPLAPARLRAEPPELREAPADLRP